MLGAVEATVIILGLGFRVRWTYTDTEMMTELLHRKEIVEAGLAETTPIEPQ